MNISNEIEKLDRLRAQGTLTEEEFQTAKSRVLSEGDQSWFRVPVSDPNKVFGIETKAWCFLMHLSQLLNVAPGAGVLAPIVMWAISKDISKEADRHGVAILNWMITLLIAVAISGVLSTLLIGIPFLIIALLLAVIFPVIGAVKAINGEFWEYPLSIHFVKYPDELEDQSHSYL